MPNAFAPLLEESKIHRRKERKEKRSSLQQKSRSKKEDRKNKRRGATEEVQSQTGPPETTGAAVAAAAAATDEGPSFSHTEPPLPDLVDATRTVASTSQRWADIHDDDEDEDELDLDVDLQLSVSKFGGSAARRLGGDFAQSKNGKQPEEEPESEEDDDDDDDEDEDEDDDEDEEEDEDENDDYGDDKSILVVPPKLKPKRGADPKAAKSDAKGARHRSTEKRVRAADKPAARSSSHNATTDRTRRLTAALSNSSHSINEEDDGSGSGGAKPVLSRQELRNLELQELTNLIYSVGLSVPQGVEPSSVACSKSRRRKKGVTTAVDGASCEGIGATSGAVFSPTAGDTDIIVATPTFSEQPLVPSPEVMAAASETTEPAAAVEPTTTGLSSEVMRSNARKAAAANAKKKVVTSVVVAPAGLSQSVTAALLQEAKKKATVKKTKQRRDKHSFDY